MDNVKIGTEAKKNTKKSAVKNKEIKKIKRTDKKTSNLYSAFPQQFNSLQCAIDSIQSPIFALDTNYCYTYYNIRHCTDMKSFYGADIGLGNNFLDFIQVEKDRELVRQNLDKVLSTGQALIEPSFKMGDASHYYCFEITQNPIRNHSGEIIGVSIVARDITETNKLQEMMAKQSEEYRTIMDTIPSIIVMTDPEGIYLRVNKAAANYLGKDPKEIIGKKLHDFFPREVVDLFIANNKQVIETGKPILGFIDKYPVPTGRYIYTHSDILPYLDQGGNIIGVVCVITDITERQKTVERLLNVSRLYSLLSETNEAIVRSADRDDLFQSLCHIAVKTGGFRMAWIGIVDEKSDHLRSVAHYGHEDGYLDTLPQNKATAVRPLSSAMAIVESKVTVIEDIENDVRMRSWRKEALKRGYRSLASIPLKPGGKFLGNFVMYSDVKENFKYKETKLLEQMGSDISFALEKMQIEEERKQTEKDLRLLATLLNNANDGIVVFNKNMEIVYVNETNLDLYGYSRDEFIRLGLRNLVTPEYAGNEQQIGGMLNKKGAICFRTAHHRKDGSIIPLEIHARKLEIEGNEYIIGIGSDITERIKAEEQLQFRAEILNAATDDIFVWDMNDNCIYVNDAACLSSGYLREELIGKHLKDLLPARSYEYLIAGADKKLLKTGEAVFEISQIRKDRSIIPAEVHSRMIKLGGRHCKVAVARSIAGRKATQEKIKNSYDQLEKTLNGITQAIASIVELRDPYTAGHQLRVAQLAQAIAQEMNLEVDRIHQIFTAASIHDIGKLSLPAEILSKPGKLSDIEYSLIRTHPLAGYNILKNIDFAYPLAQWVLDHHERMDGSGYPAGLSGEKISLEARILAIADVVEAMSSHRPYRAALGEGAAMEEIAGNKNKLYDAATVEACLRLFRERRFKFD